MEGPLFFGGASGGQHYNTPYGIKSHLMEKFLPYGFDDVVVLTVKPDESNRSNGQTPNPTRRNRVESN
jgi:hypothetical protein